MTNHDKIIKGLMQTQKEIEEMKIKYARRHEERMSKLSDEDLKSFLYLLETLGI